MHEVSEYGLKSDATHNWSFQGQFLQGLHSPTNNGKHRRAKWSVEL